MSTQPTDAEIIAVAATEGVRVRTGAAAIKFARAVLEKWGTPAPVAVEPVAWAATSEDGVVEALGMNQSRRFDTPLYLAPRPVAREPLTDVQIKDGHTGMPRDVWAFADGVRFAEQHHGIKGGQHGTE